MKSDAFISEMHDIGKLADRQALKTAGLKISGHAFYDFDFTLLNIPQPSSPSWSLQYSEKDELKPPDKDMLNSPEVVQLIPDPQIRANILLTKIADGVSASITRLPSRYRGQVSEGVHKLWNPDFYQKKGRYWAAFTDIPSLKSMFQYIDSCGTYQDFFKDYAENLYLTPEDKKAPNNIVSLFTHLELAGKIYRVLKKHSNLQSQNAQSVLMYNRQPITSVREACGHIDLLKDKGKWLFRLVFCCINFPQSLSRLQDLNVFRKRADVIKNFVGDEKTGDYVLFFTDDFMCLFIPREDELSIHELLKSFIENGLIIDYTEMEAELNLLTSSYRRAHSEFRYVQASRHLKVYERQLNSRLPPEIGPNICDSCQIREGKERIKEQVRECLCDMCHEIRGMGEPANEYAEWEGKAAWMKISLDQDGLKEMLLELFGEYVDKSSLMNNVASTDKTELKNSFRPLAVQMDFVKDYKTLLNDFKEKIYTIKDETGNPAFTQETFLYPINGYNEFGIFKAASGKPVLTAINTFTDCLKQIFPKCFTNCNFPIRLAISIAPVKYPYQEHWHFLSEPKGTIDIQSPSERLTLNALQYRVLKEKVGEANVTLSHFLHRLTEIKASTSSDRMVRLEVYERNNRNKFSAILELLEEGLTPEQILAFHNLVQEEQA